jgi:hypothetical protein
VLTMVLVFQHTIDSLDQPSGIMILAVPSLLSFLCAKERVDDSAQQIVKYNCINLDLSVWIYLVVFHLVLSDLVS